MLKVLVERQVEPGYELWVWEMLREMRSRALKTRGYLYGETWRSVDSPGVYMVLSVWASLEHWQTWAKSEPRLKMEERLTRMLKGPSTIRVFEDAAEPTIIKPATKEDKERPPEGNSGKGT